MSNVKRLTSYTHHKTAEGDRLSYTYSEIDSDGNLIKSNERATCIVMDQEVSKHLGEINKFLQTKIDSI